jgi:CheY-like chemotaxis protein
LPGTKVFCGKGKTQLPATSPISLVLEDDESSRFVLRLILERAGFKVLESAQAAEAIDICRSHPGLIAIMVSDVVLRGNDGVETVRQAQTLQPEMAILFVSGYPLEFLNTRGLLDPLDMPARNRAFLQKPFTAQAFLSAIRQLIGTPQS